MKDKSAPIQIAIKEKPSYNDLLLENEYLRNKINEVSEIRFKELFVKSEDAHLIIENGIFSDCNTAAQKMLLFPNKNELLNTHPSKISPKFQPDGQTSAKKSDEMMRIALKSGTHRFEWIHMKKDGSKFPAEVLLTRIYNDSNKYVLHAVWRDLTEIKQVEKELRHEKERVEKSKEQFKAILEQSPMSIQIFNTQGLTVSVNHAWEKLWKENKANVIGKYNILNPENSKEMDWIKYVRRAYQGETLFLPDMEFHRKNSTSFGNTKILNCIIFPLRYHGEVEQVAIIHQDITENKIHELEMMRAMEKAEESDRLKSAFLANMSHEIRTPMNGILGFTSLLKENNSTPEEQLEFIDIIEKSGFRLLGIINDLIDISKIETGLMDIKKSEFSLNKQLMYLHSFFLPEAEIKGLDLQMPQLPSDIILNTDKEKLLAILINLIKNSIKYSNEGQIEFGCELKNMKLKFYVKDQGIGIARNKFKSIFERFVQADNTLASSYEGAGLGLSITKAFVELLGGKIWLESELDIGTQFYFTLPINLSSVLNESTFSAN